MIYLTCDNENGYYALIDDVLKNNSSFKCYKSKEGYYFDKNESLLKKCYHSCKTCDKSGNEKAHYCLECKIEYINQIQYDGYYNCYNILPSYSEYTKISDEFSYTTFKPDTSALIIKNNNESFGSLECPKDYPYEIIETHQCISNCSIKNRFKNICKINNKDNEESKTESLPLILFLTLTTRHIPILAC